MSLRIFNRGFFFNWIEFLLRSSAFFIFLWLGLSALLGLKIGNSPLPLFFAASTVLLYTHVLYGGYFLFKKEEKINFTVVFLVLAVYSCLIFLARSVSQPPLWFFRLQMLLLCAMAFHLHYKARLSQEYLKEFCNYKLYVELSAFLFCFCGLAVAYLFPQTGPWLSMLIFLVIAKSNLTIFLKKKLYSIHYQTADIPEEPLLSIVVIAYNEERYIGRLLESIKQQDYHRFEVIVVDDHSTDNTLGIARSFAGEFPLKIVQKEVRGISRSRNYGATFAQGELILFLDGDVVLPPGFISKNLKIFKGERLSVAGFDFIPETDSALDRWITGFYRLWLRGVQYFNPRGIGIGLLVEKALHKKVLFDESVIMSEDFDYVRRAAQQGKFRIITAAPLEVSWRRFKQENRFLLLLKYLYFEWYRQNIGEIRKKMLAYEFGNNSPEN